MPPRAVLFDLDNTLTARRVSVERFALAFASDYKARLRNVDGENSGSDLQRMFVEADQGGYNPRRAEELCDRLPWRDSESRASVEELEDYWQTRQAFSTLLRPGALELLRELRDAGHRLDVVTNGGVRGQQVKLDHLELTPLFDAIVISEAAGCKKPAPKIFALALAELGLAASDARDTWFIGDHPVNDVLGAAAVGMRAVWIRNGHEWPTDEPSPRWQVADIAELRALLLESAQAPVAGE